MKKILILQHIGCEGAGTLGDYFAHRGYALDLHLLDQTPLLPRSLGDICAVVCLGGPMNVYEEERYSFLKSENIFLARVLDENLPFLGICLGSQLLAKALGAQVRKAPQGEMGWGAVALTAQGREDSLFDGVATEFSVFQWHGDTWDLPRGADLLAGSGMCAHQAFRYAANAYGLQFHVEVTLEMIRDWKKVYGQELTRDDRDNLNESLDWPSKAHQLAITANQIYANFEEIIRKGA